jgi:hypothetical protein
MILDAKLSDQGSRQHGSLKSPDSDAPRLSCGIMPKASRTDVLDRRRTETAITAPVDRSNSRDGLKSAIGLIPVMPLKGAHAGIYPQKLVLNFI